MAKLSFSNSKKKRGLLSSLDIMKGFTSSTSLQELYSIQPLQCISVEEKTEDWIKWNADWCENIALIELPKKAKRLQRLYNLAQGIINKSDYIINPTENDLTNHLGILGVDENEYNLLEQFFPIIPNIIQVFLGEFIKRDKKVIVSADDPETISEKLQYKEDLVLQILTEHAVEIKKAELVKQGIIPSEDPNSELSQKYNAEIQAAQQLVEAEQKFKKFRTIAERWANNFIEKFGTKNGFDELELWAFADSLIVDEAIVALNMRENDFTPEQLRPISTYVNNSPNNKYYSNANFVVNIEFMSISDIINTFRNDLSEEQIISLEDRYVQKMSGISDVLIDQYSNHDQVYNTSKSYDWNAQFSSNMRREASADAVKNWINSSTAANSFYSNHFNNQQLIRVSRIWWSSWRKIGKLTKITDESITPIIETVDENFVVTEKPVYDNSLLKEKSAKTLIKGEHVDWTYGPQKRYVVKIGQNIPIYHHLSSEEAPFQNIYLYGGPAKFQFKGNNNPYEAKHALEGCRFSNLNSISVSLVEKLRPDQIIYNVLKNKIVRLLPRDLGKVLVLPDSMVKKNSLLQEDGLDPLFEAIESIKETGVLTTDDSKETAQQSNNRFSTPIQVDMSTIEQIAISLQVAQNIKNDAYAIVGVSPQRMANIGKSESATGIQAAVEGSVNQTEMYFELFSTHFIPKVWQMILHAAQYYAVQSPSFNDVYINAEESNAFFSALKTDLLFKDLFVTVKSKADIRKVMSELKQLTIQDNTMGATFLDKVKTLFSKSPNEIIEKLEEAEEKLKQQKEKEYQHQKEMQEQQIAAQNKREKEIQAKEDARLTAKLNNDYAIAQLQVSSQVAPPDNNIKYDLDAKKIELDSAAQDSANKQNEKINILAGQKEQNNVTLAKEKLQVEREKIQALRDIALQNKSNADLKFIQMQKNKTKK